MTKIAVMNQKGGVGKTTTTLNLSAAIHRKGGQSVMLDIDPQGHLTSIHPAPPKNSEDTAWGFFNARTPLNKVMTEWDQVGKLICSHNELIKVETKFGNGPSIVFRLRDALNELEATDPNSDVLIDCPPNIGVLTLNAIFAADLVIVPISSDFLSFNGAKKIAHTLKALEVVTKKRINRLYVLTRYDKRRLMSDQVMRMAKTEFGEDVCDIVINENVALAKSTHNKQDIFSYSPTSRGAVNYLDLSDHLKSRQWA
jgi:chromosome partitioning protein